MRIGLSGVEHLRPCLSSEPPTNMFRQNFDFKVLQHKEREEPQEVVGEQGRNLRGSTKLCVE